MAKEAFSRIESPSSINTYKQCPRKYYYQYILGLPSVASIHLVRGRAVHEALEAFFKLDIDRINKESWEEELRIVLLDLFDKTWASKQDKLDELDISYEERELDNDTAVELGMDHVPLLRISSDDGDIDIENDSIENLKRKFDDFDSTDD